MSDRRLIGWGIAGLAVVGLCCLTPVLVTFLAAVGLAAIVPSLDYVLLPVAALCALVLVVGVVRRRR